MSEGASAACNDAAATDAAKALPTVNFENKVLLDGLADTQFIIDRFYALHFLGQTGGFLLALLRIDASFQDDGSIFHGNFQCAAFHIGIAG